MNFKQNANQPLLYLLLTKYLIIYSHLHKSKNNKASNKIIDKWRYGLFSFWFLIIIPVTVSAELFNNCLFNIHFINIFQFQYEHILQSFTKIDPRLENEILLRHDNLPFFFFFFFFFFFLGGGGGRPLCPFKSKFILSLLRWAYGFGKKPATIILKKLPCY